MRASRAVALGMTRVACVSTGNTSASMAAYRQRQGQPIVFIPHGNIAFGKLAQTLEYGAKTIQVQAIRPDPGPGARPRRRQHHLLARQPVSSKARRPSWRRCWTLDWRAPDWVVLPGGNLNTSAFGKGLELKRSASSSVRGSR
jgi:threonine synthase